MSIHQLDFNGNDKVEKAIMRLQAYEPPEGYYLCFSGGKDSCVIKALADMAKVKYDAHYAVSSCDPPELVRFIKDKHPDVIFDIPHDKNGKTVSMWSLIPTKTMPPTRIVRYCCAYLKERGGGGRLKVTGVRWAESVRRKKSHGEVTIMDKGKKLKDLAEQEYSHIAYKITPQGGIALPLDNRENAQMVEQCYRTRSTTVNPIIDWTDGEVWEFIKEYNIPYCCLYDQGFKRLGCIGCPMGSREQREMEFERWPKYKNLYMIAFQKMIENRGGVLRKQRTDEELYEVWMQGNEPKKPDYSKQTAEDIMNGYLTENFKDFSGGYNKQGLLTLSAEQIMQGWLKDGWRNIIGSTPTQPQEPRSDLTK